MSLALSPVQLSAATQHDIKCSTLVNIQYTGMLSKCVQHIKAGCLQHIKAG